MFTKTRPSLSIEQIKEIIKENGSFEDYEIDDVTDTFMRHWEPLSFFPPDAYRIARDLDDNYLFDVSEVTVEEISTIGSKVRDEFISSQKEWNEGWKKTALPIGTMLKEGEITEISTWRPGCYEVQTEEMKKYDRFYCIPFEMAIVRKKKENA
ncbi:hypothetical protein A3715_10205 [Oleiphilus sp. HI0009]|nr:hypothetical protein A3715_10205 [Oleiphilus sp. HI0009]